LTHGDPIKTGLESVDGLGYSQMAPQGSSMKLEQEIGDKGICCV